MKRIFTLLMFITTAAFAQDDSIANRLVLIGDAGGLINGRPVVIDAVRKTVKMDKKTTVLFLGDNLYTVGLPDEQYATYNLARSVLDSQAALVLNTPAKAIFIPGNHDWANGAPRGYEQVIRQQLYIDRIAKDNVKFYPEDGCAGPVQVNMSKDVVLIIMDSQWWLNRYEKPGIESDCPYKTEDEVLTQIKDIITNNPRKLILFACHHPFRSTGVHSGYYGWKQHLFPFTDLNRMAYIPLPLLGSIYPIARGVFGSPQDMQYPAYENMINSVEAILKEHPYVIHLHGHEHTMQYIKDSNYNYIISGAGCKMSRVAQSKKTKYAVRSLGFAVMDIMKNKNVNITFYEVPLDGSEVNVGYKDSMLNFSKFPELAEDTVTVHDFVFKENITTPVNASYDKAKPLKRKILGNNYRAEWAKPVNVKVFDIREAKGGLKITGLSGGNQSRSLHMVDKKGKEWVLRSINKNPAKAIPANFRNAFTGVMVQDMISASHPYGAAVVPDISDAMHVPHPTPQFVFVPDDYALGYYRPVFANTMCMLEEAEPTIDGTDAKSTSKVFNKMLEDHDNHVDQVGLLRARLVDLLIADFDRHEDQWKWGVKDTGKGKLYYPIPRDRDQSLFHSDGLLVKMISRKRMPFLKGLTPNIYKPKWQNYVARNFDHTFLNDLDAQEWEKTLKEFDNNVTNEVIDKAVHKLPPEIYAMDGKEITEKLITRRDKVHKASMQYYKFLSRDVNVLGSNEDEYFRVSDADSGIMLNVYAKRKDGDTSLYYSRYFNPRVTHEIRMYGFNGNDVFQVDDGVKSSIKLRMIGGKGTDTFNIKGSVRNFLYDLSTEDNPILSRGKTEKMFSSKPVINNYVAKEFDYPIFRFPRVVLGYNTDDGVMAGIGAWYRTYGFRKEPYSTDQKLNVITSFVNKAYQVNYRGSFNHLVRNYDLLVNTDVVTPTVNNFFGFGNESYRNTDIDLRYYRTRYSYTSADILIRNRLIEKLVSVSAGPTYYYYWNHYERNSDRILSNPSALGLDSASIYGHKMYAGAKLVLNVNNQNDENFPTRGVNWNTEFTQTVGLNKNSHSLSKLESNMTIYASLTDPAILTAVVHLGAGRIFTDNVEYFQAFNLGSNNYMRGYVKNRFSGNGMAYSSIELRWKLLDVKSFIMPGKLGLVGFDDFGRVWVNGEDSKKWHNTYGGGLYYTPFNFIMVSGVAGLSPEGVVYNFSLGTKLNFTF